MSTEKKPTQVITGPVRLSYAKVWKPEAMDDDPDSKKKYSTAVLIDKDDTETLSAIEAAIDHIEAEVKAANKGKLPPKWKRPLRDGDEERPTDTVYAGKMFFNASSLSKPGIVKKVAGKVVEITDEEEVYSGVFARVSVNFYPFDTKGNRGIAVGLNNILKVRDGEKLAGGSDPADDFADCEDTDEGVLENDLLA